MAYRPDNSDVKGYSAGEYVITYEDGTITRIRIEDADEVCWLLKSFEDGDQYVTLDQIGVLALNEVRSIINAKYVPLPPFS